MQYRYLMGYRGWAGVLIAGVLAGLVPTLAEAQVVPDGTLGRGNNSALSINGNRTDIIGGLRLNSALFHSFDQFSVGTNRQVYFANPVGVRDIFSRVTGGSLSKIDGVLGVSGSANLFFMNPNGIVFGPNARLDVAGSFTATTASGVEFADNQRFAATGDRAVPLVEVNVPIGLQYGANPPAMLTNRGNLAAGKDLTLAAGNLDLQGQLQAGENLTLNATDTVKIRDTVTEPFVAQAGNKLLVQGNQQVDIFALNHPASGLISGGDMVLRSANTVIGDAHYWTGGSFQIEQMDGNLGNLFSPYDPVIRATGDVSFASYNGNSLHIFAGGRVSIPGNVTIQNEDGINGIDEDVLLTLPLPSGGTLTEMIPIRGRSQPTLDIRAGTLAVGVPGLIPNPIPGAVGSISLSGASGSDITIGTITNINFNARIFLTNQFQPDLALNNGNIRITNSITPPGLTELFGIAAYGVPVTIAARGDVQATSGIVTGSQNIPGGNIRIFSGSNIDVSGGRLFSQTTNSSSGNIRLEALGRITTGEIDTRVSGTMTGNAGDVRLSAGGNITTGNRNDIISRVENGATGTGGNISIISQNGSITNFDDIESSTANGRGGLINIQANGDIQADDISSQVRAGVGVVTGRGGDITITSLNGAVRNLGTVESSTPNGDGGGSTVRHGGDITIQANGGSISAGAIRSFVGTIDTAAEATGATGNAGTINLNASGGISVLGRNQSFTGTGNGGSIFFVANDTIDAGALRSFVGTIATDQIATTGGTGAAGTITLQSNAGAINVSSDISAFSGTDTISAANVGNVTLIATDTIRTRDIIRTYIGNSDSTGKVTGGTGNPGAIKITLNSSNPNAEIDTTQGSLSSAGPLKGGDITLESTGNIRSIRTANITSKATANVGNADGGKIVFDSKGNIDTSRGTLNSEGSDDGGSVQLTANGNIVTGNISSISPGTFGFGGPISLVSKFGGINTVAGTLTSEGFLRGGIVELRANQDIATRNVISRSTGSNSGTGGSLTFTSQNGKIDTSLGILNSQGGRSGGSVALAARQDIDAGNIFSTSEGRGSSGTGGNIAINSDVGNINIVDRTIRSSASGNADGGNINIAANSSVNITNSFTTAETFGGNSGNITVQSKGDNLTFAGGALKTTVNAGATGSGGDITINSNGGQISFGNGFQVNAATKTTAASGRGGDVSISSNGGLIKVDGNSAIDASTSGTQKGGTVSVLSGSNNILLNSGSISTTVNPSATADGGSIAITSNGGNLTFGDAATSKSFQVNAQTQATNAIGTAQTNGKGGNVTISTGSGDIALVAKSTITAGTTGTKDSGTVAIAGGNLTLGNSAISTTSSIGSGKAGNIDVTGNNIGLTGSQIKANSTGLGSAGYVKVTGTNISLVGETKRSEISTSALGAGASAGNVTLNASGSSTITLQNSDVLASSQQGASGKIEITARRADLNNATIKAETGQNTPGSKAGSITLNLGFRLTLENESEISTLGQNGANGGDIKIMGVRFLLAKQPTGPSGSDIVGRAENNIPGGLVGQGGTVTLDPRTLVSGFRFRKAVDGNGTNDIDTNGQLNNFSTDADVAGRGLSTPLIVFNDVSQIARSACEAVGAKASTTSELKITGQGGVPQSPTAPLPAQNPNSDWVALELSPQVPIGLKTADGSTLTLEPGKHYQLPATCIRSWQQQQRSQLSLQPALRETTPNYSPSLHNLKNSSIINRVYRPVS